MLIFDFDGVLVNSLDEVVLTAYNAVADSHVTSLEQVPADLVQMFKRNRFHVQPIGDAIGLMHWCLANCQKEPQRILNREDYAALTGRSDIDLVDRTNLIYAARKRFIDTDIERWLALHQPYQPLWNELVRRKNYLFVILTNKNHDATYRLCRHFGLKIDAQDIYSGDNGLTKIENMGRIQERFGRQSFVFIDDSIKNLQELDQHFNRDEKLLSLALATWGYTGAQDGGTAREFGYASLRQSDAMVLLADDAA